MPVAWTIGSDRQNGYAAVITCANTEYILSDRPESCTGQTSTNTEFSPECQCAGPTATEDSYWGRLRALF